MRIVFAAVFAALSLSAFANEGASMTLQDRVESRAYPSVFQAWSRADNLDEDEWKTVARHDLVWSSPEFFWLRWEQEPSGIATSFVPETIEWAQGLRDRLREMNPNIVTICEIRYRDAWDGFLPADHRWWKREENGERVAGWDEGGFYMLDYENPEYQAHVAAQAKAVVDSGVIDGVMLDWWIDDEHRLALAKAVRAAIGDDALIIVNSNDRQIPQTAPYVNGLFMEAYRSATPEDWHRLANTLSWAEANLREPRVNCLETWFHESRQDLHLMRATTTLALTHSDGYALFSDPNPLPTPDHLHDWYPFWEKSLGRPTAPGEARPEGHTIRRFENGVAMYNPMGNESVTVELDGDYESLATGKRGSTHVVPPSDGDILIAR